MGLITAGSVAVSCNDLGATAGGAAGLNVLRMDFSTPFKPYLSFPENGLSRKKTATPTGCSP